MFHVHLTASTSAYEKGLIYGLVEKGYVVARASDLCISLQYSENGSALISLQVEKLSELHSPEVYDDVMAILSKMNAKFYSLIVTQFAYDARWVGSNFEIADFEKEKKALN